MTYKIERKQLLPISIDEAWEYFSNPKNLNEITPDELKFRFVSKLPDKIYQGLIIIYKIRLIGIFHFEWVTEITKVQDKMNFIDNQVKGPYRLWHHEHHFIPVGDNTEMIDIVHYTLPFGFIGRLAHWLWVKKQVKKIFDYRTEKLDELFGKED